MKIKPYVQGIFTKFHYIKMSQLKYLVDDIEHLLHLRVDLSVGTATYLYILLQSILSELYLEIFKHLEYGKSIIDKDTKQKKIPTGFRDSLKLLLLYEKKFPDNEKYNKILLLKSNIDHFVSTNKDNIRYLKTIRNDTIAHNSTHFSNDHYFILSEYRSKDIFHRPDKIIDFVDDAVDLIKQTYVDIHKMYKSNQIKKTKNDNDFYEMGYEMLEYLVNKYSTDENSKI